MNEPDHTQKEQSVENADCTGKSFTEEAFYISKIPDDIFEKMQENHTRQIVPYRGKISAIFMCSTWGLTVRQKRENLW